MAYLLILPILAHQSSTGDANGDQISGVENIIGSIAADTLTGNAKSMKLKGALVVLQQQWCWQ